MEFRGKYGHSGTSKSGCMIAIICSNFLRNETYLKEISSRNSILYTFLIKINSEPIVFSYHFIIYLESSAGKKYFLQLEYHIELLVHQ